MIQSSACFPEEELTVLLFKSWRSDDTTKTIKYTLFSTFSYCVHPPSKNHQVGVISKCQFVRIVWGCNTSTGCRGVKYLIQPSVVHVCRVLTYCCIKHFVNSDKLEFGEMSFSCIIKVYSNMIASNLGLIPDRRLVVYSGWFTVVHNVNDWHWHL